MLRNQYLIGLLCLLLLGVAVWNINFFAKRKAALPQAARTQAAPAVSGAQPAQPAVVNVFPVPQDTADWRRDPFRRRSAAVQEDEKAAREEELVLKGIVTSSGNRFALIDGRVVGVGDRIQGYRVSAINRYSILLKGNQGTKEIRIIHDTAKEK